MEKFFVKNFIDRLVGVTEEEWKKVEPLVRKKTLKKNEVLFPMGEIIKDIGFIRLGLLRFYTVDKSGDEFNQYFASEGELISSYASFITGTESQIEVAALEETEIEIINYQEFLKLFEGEYKWEKLRRMLAEGQYLIKFQREQEFLKLQAIERYQKFKIDRPGIVDRISQYQVASYLGVTPFTLNRLLKQAKEKGVEI